jgi:hypothetical protein
MTTYTVIKRAFKLPENQDSLKTVISKNDKLNMEKVRIVCVFQATGATVDVTGDGLVAHAVQRVLGETVARFLPLLEAAVVAGYAYYDTKKVGATAIDLFSTASIFRGDVELA